MPAVFSGVSNQPQNQKREANFKASFGYVK